MCDRTVSDVPFMILYCPNEYITQKMCDDDVYGSIETYCRLVCYK